MKIFWRGIPAVALLLSFAAPAGSEPPEWFDRARAIFAKHDPQGRLKWTSIGRLGDVRLGKITYTIYNLSFVNYRTASRHGMQQVSIIMDDRIFVGSYIDVAEPAVAIRGQIVSMKQQIVGGKASPQTYFRIGVNGPPRKNVLLAGGFHDLENSI
jgi:hypothetical protein